MDWDDLKTLLAVARNGSITGGAQALGLDQSTVSRRLQSFEQKVGQELFQGGAKQRRLTIVGERFLEAAQRMESEVEALERDVTALSEETGGTINVVTTDFLSNLILLSISQEFLKNHPDIQLRVRTQDQADSTLRGDVALLATNNPAEDMYGRRLATATYAAYATADYLASFDGRWEEMIWLNWDDGSDRPTWPKQAPAIPDHRVRLRVDSVMSIFEAARLGLGATILPCYIGERDSALVRVTPGAVVSRRELWLLVQSDLRKVPRVRLFLDFMSAQVKKDKSLIEAD